jgi:Kef-type K+ transport system membrane component KefB
MMTPALRNKDLIWTPLLPFHYSTQGSPAKNLTAKPQRIACGDVAYACVCYTNHKEIPGKTLDHAIFFELSLVMVVAAAASLIARGFRQPLVIAYIIAGFLAGPSVLSIIKSPEAFESFSQIGITLLLFIIGLGLNTAIIKTTGRQVALVFLGIIAGIGLLGMLSGILFGFTRTEALLVTTSLLFSSTIIVVKSLSDKNEQSRLYGQLAIGVLLVEDIAATLVLLLISSMAGNSGGLGSVLSLLGKGLALGAALAFTGGFIMPRLSKLFASSQELLYVFAVAWTFGVASAFYKAGFSLEVGALFAGVSLAHLPYVQAIAARLKPLRDFFIVLFFIGLGHGLHLDNVGAALGPAITLSLIVLVSKPVLIMTFLGLLGYTKQTSFKAGIHLSQISELSVIMLVLAAHFGVVGERMITIATLTALFTIAASAYLMKYDDRLYRRLQKYLSVFERDSTRRELRTLGHYPLVLIGYHEGGLSFVQTFRRMKKRYVVIDYNPDVVEVLEHQHINHLYGDATDTELLEEININKSEVVISTLTDTETNRTLAERITREDGGAIFVCQAARLDDAKLLYEAGASYVLTAHLIGHTHINDFLEKHGNDKKAFEKYRDEHLSSLETIAQTD